mmetsp:Transcript_127663/g.234973  ORF Transcript_127663/g.234973 Transcript_127663/m.234973 type:complete len:268 (+) Transcript_127663:549-1352(+)
MRVARFLTGKLHSLRQALDLETRLLQVTSQLCGLSHALPRGSVQLLLGLLAFKIFSCQIQLCFIHIHLQKLRFVLQLAYSPLQFLALTLENGLHPALLLLPDLATLVVHPAGDLQADHAVFPISLHEKLFHALLRACQHQVSCCSIMLPQRGEVMTPQTLFSRTFQISNLIAEPRDFFHVGGVSFPAPFLCLAALFHDEVRLPPLGFADGLCDAPCLRDQSLNGAIPFVEDLVNLFIDHLLYIPTNSLPEKLGKCLDSFQFCDLCSE